MGITVANLIAQVGADLTQFRLGMNEVEARLEHAQAKARNAETNIARMNSNANALQARSESKQTGALAINLAPFQAEAAKLRVEAEAAASKFEAAQQLYFDKAKAFGKSSSLAEAYEIQRDKLKAEFEKADNDFKTANRKLEVNLAKRDALLKGAAADSGRASDLINRAQTYETERSLAANVSKAYANRLQQNANEYKRRAINNVGNTMAVAGAVGIGGLAAGAEAGSGIEEQMMNAYHNTTMTTQGLQEMRDTISKLGKESGADLGQLIDGFRKIQNYGNEATDTTKILTVAMHSSVATGTDLADVANILAGTLKTFNIPASQAVHVMDQFHLAANLSSLSLSEFSGHASPAMAAASRMGISLTETNSALVLFTRYLQGDAPRATTQFVNAMNKIANPSKLVQTELGNLREASKKAGVDLERDFTNAGVRIRGIANIIQDIKKVAEVRGDVPSDLISKLVPALRGTAGAAIAIQHTEEYKDISEKLNAVIGQLSLTEKQYAESLGLVSVQSRRAKDEIMLLFDELSIKLAPQIKEVINNVIGLIDGFTSLPDGTKKSVIAMVEVGSALLIFTGLTLKAVVAISSIKTALIELNVISEGAGILSLFAKIPPQALIAVAAIAGVALVVGGLIKLYNNMSGEEAISSEQMMKNADAAHTAAVGNYNNAVEVDKLVKQYNALAKQAVLTGTDQDTMQKILNKISDIAPQMIKGYDSVGNAIGFIGDNAANTTIKLKEMVTQIQRTAAAQSITSSMNIADQQNAERNAIRLNLIAKAHGKRFLGGIDSGIDADQFLQHDKDIRNNPALDPNTLFKMRYKEFGPANDAASNTEIHRLQALIDEQEKNRISVQNEAAKALHGIPPEVNPLNLDKNHGGKVPPDHFKGLGDKPKKDRSGGGKESLNDRLRDYIDNIYQATQLLGTEGKLADVESELTHAFNGTTEALKERARAAANAYDAKANHIKLDKENADQLDRINDANKKALEFMNSPLGKHTTPLQDAIKQLSDDKNFMGNYDPLSRAFGIAQVASQYSNNVKTSDAIDQKKKDDEEAAKEAIKERERGWKRVEKEQNEKEKIRLKGQNAITDFHDALSDSVDQAKINLQGTNNPDQRAYLEYYDKMMDKIKDKVKLGTVEMEQAKQEINSHWNQIDALNKEAAARQKIIDINANVAAGLNDLTAKFAINYNGLKISNDEWSKMTKQEQKAAQQLVKLSQFKELVDNAMKGIEQIFYTSLNNIRDKGFRNFFTDIINMFQNMLFEMATKWLASYFVNQIVGALGSIFGGSTGGKGGNFGQGGMGGVAATGGDMGGLLPHAAFGGPAIFGRAMIVGEKGPELFIPRANGQILPNGQSSALMNGGGGITINMNISATDAGSFRRTEAQLGSRIAQAVNRAQRRNT